MLPKTAKEISNGGVYRQAIRCGKFGCRCASGDLHEGYYYFIRRIYGRLSKTYIPKRQVNQFSLLVEQSRRNRQTERETERRDRELLTEFRARLRENDSMVKAQADALKE